MGPGLRRGLIGLVATAAAVLPAASTAGASGATTWYGQNFTSKVTGDRLFFSPNGGTVETTTTEHRLVTCDVKYTAAGDIVISAGAVDGRVECDTVRPTCKALGSPCGLEFGWLVTSDLSTSTKDEIGFEYDPNKVTTRRDVGYLRASTTSARLETVAKGTQVTCRTTVSNHRRVCSTDQPLFNVWLPADGLKAS